MPPQRLGDGKSSESSLFVTLFVVISVRRVLFGVVGGWLKKFGESFVDGETGI